MVTIILTADFGHLTSVMKLRFIWPGKTKDEHLRALLAEYLKRLQRFVRCEVIETREFSGSEAAWRTPSPTACWR